MCRLLAIEGSTTTSFPLYNFLPEFAEQSKFELAPDHSLQADGSGIVLEVPDFDFALEFWQDLSQRLNTDPEQAQFSYTINNASIWQVLYLSLTPLWQSIRKFPYEEIPDVQRLVVHARAASVPETIGQLKFNQPHLDGPTTFAFNGSLEKVQLKVFQNKLVYAGRFDRQAVPTQKLMNLLHALHEGRLDANFPMVVAMQELNKLLTEKFECINGLNIISATPEGLYALCGTHAKELDEYYTLYAGEPQDNDGLAIVSSFPFGELELNPLEVGEVFYSEQQNSISGIQPAMV